MVQVDCYAAKANLSGLPPEEVPSIWQTLKQGWTYLLVIAFLIFGLIYMRWGIRSAIYASALMILLSYTKPSTFITPRKFLDILREVGVNVIRMMAILLPTGFLMISIYITGTMTNLTVAIVSLGGSSVVLILLIAVVLSYIMGMVGISFIAYIVLAVVAVPGLISATGMSELAIHLFLIYWLLTTVITPPVAICAFVAANLANAPPMKTAWTASRLAIVIYFVPFFFVFNPALVLEGPIYETIYLFALCLLGIWILSSGLEGYILKLGRLPLWTRSLLVIGGFLIALPGWQTTIGGAVLSAMTFGCFSFFRKRTKK
jgi:TRAP-type uncharacterized transport system fused permease subunit